MIIVIIIIKKRIANAIYMGASFQAYAWSKSEVHAFLWQMTSCLTIKLYSKLVWNYRFQVFSKLLTCTHEYTMSPTQEKEINCGCKSPDLTIYQYVPTVFKNSLKQSVWISVDGICVSCISQIGYVEVLLNLHCCWRDDLRSALKRKLA